MWFSKIDINTRNLKVQKGQVLPNIWQTRAKVSYLQEEFGNDSFIFQAQNEVINASVLSNKVPDKVSRKKRTT